MYLAVLGFHSLLRWIILALGSLAVFAAFTQGGAARRRVVPFVVALDLQLVAGAVLWLSLSPLTRSLGAGAMANPEVRRFAVEHPVLGIAAAALAHAGSVLLGRGKVRPGALLLAAALLGVMAAIPWARPMLRTMPAP